MNDSAAGIVIAIDGPAGSGKSTAARNLAAAEGFAYLNTGALYRAVAFLTEDGGVDAERRPDLAARIARDMVFEYVRQDDGLHFWVAARPGAAPRDLTQSLFTASLTQRLRPVVNNEAVRAALVDKMRQAARTVLSRGAPGVILEGRDIGTVVFPEAFLKFYLSADLAARTQRRAEELRARGETFQEDGLRQQIEFRDQMDRSRAVGPLVRAPDAIEVDTTHLTPEETLGRLRAELARRRSSVNGQDLAAVL